MNKNIIKYKINNEDYRVTFCSDKEAADMKMRINALSQAFGYTDRGACMDAMIVTLDKAAEKELDSL